MNPQTSTLRQRLKSFERDLLIEAISQQPRRLDQAKLLGVHPVSLWRKLTEHGLINGPDAPA